jgi:hypothetical protein
MSNRINSSPDPAISSVLSQGPTDGWLSSPEAHLRSALAAAIRSSRFSRGEIAERLTRLLRRPPEHPITTYIIDSWTSETKERVKFPAAWAAAFSLAVENDRLQLALLTPPLRSRLEIKKDLESLRCAITSLRCAITVLLVDERKRARAKNNGGVRRPHAKQGRRRKQ